MLLIMSLLKLLVTRRKCRFGQFDFWLTSSCKHTDCFQAQHFSAGLIKGLPFQRPLQDTFKKLLASFTQNSRKKLVYTFWPSVFLSPMISCQLYRTKVLYNLLYFINRIILLFSINNLHHIYRKKVKGTDIIFVCNVQLCVMGVSL